MTINAIQSKQLRQNRSINTHLVNNFRFKTLNSICQNRKNQTYLVHPRSSSIAFQNLPIYFTYDANWRRNRLYVTSGFMKNSLKSRRTWKRCTIEQTLQKTTYRKSVIAFQNLPFYQSARRRRDVASVAGLQFTNGLSIFLYFF